MIRSFRYSRQGGGGAGAGWPGRTSEMAYGIVPGTWSSRLTISCFSGLHEPVLRAPARMPYGGSHTIASMNSEHRQTCAAIHGALASHRSRGRPTRVKWASDTRGRSVGRVLLALDKPAVSVLRRMKARHSGVDSYHDEERARTFRALSHRTRSSGSGSPYWL
jgi:hypothetical protein